MNRSNDARKAELTVTDSLGWSLLKAGPRRATKTWTILTSFAPSPSCGAEEFCDKPFDHQALRWRPSHLRIVHPTHHISKITLHLQRNFCVGEGGNEQVVALLWLNSSLSCFSCSHGWVSWFSGRLVSVSSDQASGPRQHPKSRRRKNFI